MWASTVRPKRQSLAFPRSTTLSAINIRSRVRDRSALTARCLRRPVVLASPHIVEPAHRARSAAKRRSAQRPCGGRYPWAACAEPPPLHVRYESPMSLRVLCPANRVPFRGSSPIAQSSLNRAERPTRGPLHYRFEPRNRGSARTVPDWGGGPCSAYHFPAADCPSLSILLGRPTKQMDDTLRPRRPDLRRASHARPGCARSPAPEMTSHLRRRGKSQRRPFRRNPDGEGSRTAGSHNGYPQPMSDPTLDNSTADCSDNATTRYPCRRHQVLPYPPPASTEQCAAQGYRAPLAHTSGQRSTALRANPGRTAKQALTCANRRFEPLICGICRKSVVATAVSRRVRRRPPLRWFAPPASADMAARAS